MYVSGSVPYIYLAEVPDRFFPTTYMVQYIRYRAASNIYVGYLSHNILGGYNSIVINFAVNFSSSTFELYGATFVYII